MSTVTLLLHGAGSCPRTALDLLGPAVVPGSAADAPAAAGSVDDVVALLTATVAEHRRRGTEVVRVAGISLGAHAAVIWAARSGEPVELVLAMPAWGAAPGEVAAMTTRSADEVRRVGPRAVLDRLRADPETATDWVREELERGWATYDDDALVAALHAAGTSRGPSDDELRAVRAPAAVVALADDPLHPEAVARAWAAAMPTAGLAVVGRHEPAHDRGAIGRAASQILVSLNGSR